MMRTDKLYVIITSLIIIVVVIIIIKFIIKDPA